MAAERASAPPLLFGLLLFAALTVLLTRGSLIDQAPPLVSLRQVDGVRVLFGEGFIRQGVSHLFDGATLKSVTKMTEPSADALPVLFGVDPETRLVDGMALELYPAEVGTRLEVGWMSARQRLAMGIPLHPDRMSLDDWCTLPGIGEKMATRIEQDRQKYGDFGSYEALDRVKGIGPAKMKSLRRYFSVIDKSLD